MKSFRYLFRFFGRFYKREYGKYTILTKYFFPYFATQKNELDVVKIQKKYKMALDTSEYIQGHLFVFNCFEPDTIKVIRNVTKKGDVVLDIGANIGYLTLVFADATGANGKVYAFEPDELNYQRLIKNVSLNNYSNIFPHKLALSNKNTKIKLFKAKDNNLGSHSIIYNPDVLNNSFDIIETIPGDKFVMDYKISKIDVIKIDVEGAEYEVLQGLEKSLSRFKPIVIMEINNPIQEKRGISSAELKNILIQKNYTSFNIMQDGKIEYSPLDYRHDIDNVIFIPNERINIFTNIIKK